MTVLLIILALVVLDVLAVHFGADSRDGRPDWMPSPRPRAAGPPGSVTGG